MLKSEINEFTQILRKIALNTFSNISTLGSIEQLRVLLDLDLLHLLYCQLNYRIDMSEDIIEVSRQKSESQNVLKFYFWILFLKKRNFQIVFFFIYLISRQPLKWWITYWVICIEKITKHFTLPYFMWSTDMMATVPSHN